MKCGAAVQGTTMELSYHSVILQNETYSLNVSQHAAGDYIENALKCPIKDHLKKLHIGNT